ncbi:bacillithiol system redox-active protein YtxJ [Flavobacterium azooxidireducens]|uniref:Bacillithiol system redox-active protein YtxJ n=1 Tax=Flavobacterium azooxidireducens TaxID=1871076 RepID=A0ABY4KFL3_9FLAO|nr:bacillithiol system redox-active protein YtxJ [Flavobacterium azooxidireducens]UPQ78503.1 bacillithiol system redox-active protein YtxJ [Flavobacterium azooxidireducens]
MSFFTNLFGNSEEENSSKAGWRMLTDLGQLNELIELSYQQPVLIFKHSTRCSISRFALKNFENEYAFSEEDLQPYFLDLLEYRTLSNEIANRFDVMHQSPQILLIKKGKCVYDESHDGIDVGSLKRILG